MNAINTIARDSNVIPESISSQSLVERAGANVAKPRVVFERNVYDGTLANARNPFDAIEGFKDAIYSEFETVERSQEFHGYTADDVAVALQAVLMRSDAGVPQPVSNDPTVQPSTRIISLGYDWKTGAERTTVVPAGEMSLPMCRSTNPKQWQPTMRVRVPSSGSPYILANVLRCDQDVVEGVFGYVYDWLKVNSIYLGQVVDVGFNFMKLTDHKPENVALTQTLRRHIEHLVTGPLLYGDAYDQFGLPRKSGLFLWGPPGGGKTMAKTTCGYLAARLGAVVVEVDPSLGVAGFQAAAVRTERLLENGHKVVIMMEDMEKLAVSDRAKVLDILDGTSSKGFRRITIGTTNFLNQIDRAMLRPGRFDAVEYCGLPDLSAFTQLIQVLIAEEQRGEIDYAEAFPYFDGYSYAFIANAVQDIFRAAIVRQKGIVDDLRVTTADLISAAHAVRGHFDLMQEEVVEEKPTLDMAFKDLVYEQISDYLGNNSVMTEDSIDYGYISELIHEQTDQVVEGRMDGASVVLEDSKGNTTEGNVSTN